MKYEELVILLPCHSLEDFPTHHEGDDAEGLLAGWSALWRPELIAAAGAMPIWRRVDDPPEETANRLIVIPSVSQEELPTGFPQRARDSGACVIRKQTDRAEIVRLALESLDGGAVVEEELAADFLALGYCYLQVELLTRQMRYSSNLDEVYFQDLVVAGARAAVENDAALAREKLEACFNVLAEERDHYYPVEVFLLDMTLLAPSTLGESLRKELQTGAPLNFLLNGETLEKMAAEEPESLAALKAALHRDEEPSGLMGGEVAERRWPLMSTESLLAELQRGAATYVRHLDRPAKVFARRRYGLTPAMPQMLKRLGYRGALHATLDDGRFPEGSQAKINWRGFGEDEIDAIARPPMDAAKPQTFLQLALKLGESMDMDHVATCCLAHWPGGACMWLDELRRISRFTNALGKFISIDAYFKDVDHSGHPDQFDSSQYRSPYLKQAVIRRREDPVSSSVRYWRRRAQAQAVKQLTFLAQMAGAQAGEPAPDFDLKIDEAAESAGDESLDFELTQAVAAAAQRLADALPRGEGAPQPGLLVANPSSFVRRLNLETTELASPPTVEKPIYSAGKHGDVVHTAVDTPPLGYAWVTAGSGGASDAPPLAEENVLRNEYFEAVINPVTGALQSLNLYNRRSNRMSQQLALRSPVGRETGQASSGQADYSVMAADSLEITACTAAMAETTVAGRLLDKEGTRLAGFKQIFRVWRGSRVLHVAVELDIEEEPKADPWNSYYCCRFAWADEASSLWTAINEHRQPVAAGRFEAPLYVEIENGDDRTAILTGGMPFHRRVGLRMMDTVLLARGESARRFEFGVGVDLTHPTQDALGFLAPPIVVPQNAAPPKPPRSWLFHVGAKNVVATDWAPLMRDGAIVGFTVRLLETDGRPVSTPLQTFRPVATARKVDFQGEKLDDCEINEGRLMLKLAGGEFAQLEAEWA